MNVQGFILCLDWEEYQLEFPECLDIRFSRLGDPMRIFKIKQNDTAPVLYARLLDKNENPVDLTSLNEIKFIMKECFYFTEDEEEQIKVQKSDNVTLDPQNPGAFQYNWDPEDTDTCSEYRGEFQITLNGVKSTSGAAYELADGQTLDVDVDGTGAQTITFNSVDFANILKATPAEVVAVLNAQLTGATAVVTVDGTAILLQTNTTDLTGSIQVVGGDANKALIFNTNLIKNSKITVPNKALPIEISEDLENN